jgi:hypothetical protein
MNLTGHLQKIVGRYLPKRFYCEDALMTTHNHAFMEKIAFKKSYARGVQAAGKNSNNRWRVHVALWVAEQCVKLEGDFAELGVNYGATSSAIMSHLNWNNVKKRFWLVDSFSGVDVHQLSQAEVKKGAAESSFSNISSGAYNSNLEICKKNFSEWQSAMIIKGWIPECLHEIAAEKIAYLHIDLNSSRPEVEAFRYLLPKLSPGALVLLDDYAYCGFENTRIAWDTLGAELGFTVLSLPTGQGLIYKTPAISR